MKFSRGIGSSKKVVASGPLIRYVQAVAEPVIGRDAVGPERIAEFISQRRSDVRWALGLENWHENLKPNLDGLKTPRIALTLVEQIAPGCIDVVYSSLFEGVSPDQLCNILAEAVA